MLPTATGGAPEHKFKESPRVLALEGIRDCQTCPLISQTIHLRPERLPKVTQLRSEVLSCPAQNSVHTALGRDSGVPGNTSECAFPAGGPQLVPAFIINHLLVALVTIHLRLCMNLASRSGWAGLMISNIPLRLREAE